MTVRSSTSIPLTLEVLALPAKHHGFELSVLGFEGFSNVQAQAPIDAPGKISNTPINPAFQHEWIHALSLAIGLSVFPENHNRLTSPTDEYFVTALHVVLCPEELIIPQPKIPSLLGGHQTQRRNGLLFIACLAVSDIMQEHPEFIAAMKATIGDKTKDIHDPESFPSCQYPTFSWPLTTPERVIALIDKFRDVLNSVEITDPLEEISDIEASPKSFQRFKELLIEHQVAFFLRRATDETMKSLMADLLYAWCPMFCTAENILGELGSLKS